MIDLPIAAGLAAASWILVCAVRYWTQRHGVVDVPNHRSSHTRPTPRGGGFAIALISIAGFAAYWLYRPVCDGYVVAGYCGGATIIALVGWIDDLRGLPTFVRFAVHALTAVVLLFLLGGFSGVIAIPTVGRIPLAWLGVPIAFLWIVGLTNAYNFMDGIDGIAGAQAVVAGLGWVVLAEMIDQPALGVLGLVVAASSLGFLVHNWAPARVFMGDVGSTFLGYTFAVVALVAGMVDPRLYVAGVLLVWPFVFDTALTFFRRLSKRENVFAAHRSHLYQRLILAGWGHGSVASLYAALASLGLLLAVAFVAWPGPAGWVVAAPVAIMAPGLWIFVSREEYKRAAERPGEESSIEQKVIP